MDIGEILESGMFWALTLVGYLAFSIMLILLNSFGVSVIETNGELTPLIPIWVKIAVFLIIPIIAAVWSSFYN